VVEDGHVIGLIDLTRVREIPRDAWPSTSVRDVAAADLADIIAAPGDSVDSVLHRLEPGGRGAILVVEDRRLSGIVTRADVIRLVRESAGRT
jgi:predicted transcriptional regulator